MYDWNCLIGSLVIRHDHLTSNFVANVSDVLFIYTYISLACLYMVFIYPYISHVRCALGARSVCEMRPSRTWEIPPRVSWSVVTTTTLQVLQ